MARPKKDGKKVMNNVVKIRMTDEDLESLDFVVKELKTTRSSAIRTIIREAENILQNRYKK